jgi:hypothetical protein
VLMYSTTVWDFREPGNQELIARGAAKSGLVVMIRVEKPSFTWTYLGSKLVCQVRIENANCRTTNKVLALKQAFVVEVTAKLRSKGRTNPCTDPVTISSEQNNDFLLSSVINLFDPCLSTITNICEVQ